MREVAFKYGVPLIVMDVIEYLTGINCREKLIKQVNQGEYADVMDSFDDEFINLKHDIDEEFYEQRILPLFNAMGEHNLLNVPQ